MKIFHLTIVGTEDKHVILASSEETARLVCERHSDFKNVKSWTDPAEVECVEVDSLLLG